MDIKHLYENTELTLQQIANKSGHTYKQVWKYVKHNYSTEYRKNRKSICYRNSKLADKNPMFGKRLDETPTYIGNVSDNKGYLMHVKPDWYTGRKNSRHVFVHHILICEHLGLTEIPRGYHVHHCDFNPLNNHIDNLVLIAAGDHMKLHRFLEGVTTISKESTLKWVETHGTPWTRDDIV
ncbi:MAG: HNH endonuclease [Turicibacter sp.]